jgi:gluconate 2-dehydrogenase subunit 3-like protein
MATGTTPGGQGRFEGFDVLGEAGTWDEATKGVVLARLAPPPSLRFFTTAEEADCRVLLDLLLDQHEEPRVPVIEEIDRRLVEGEGDGWHHAEMPPDAAAWRRSLAILSETSERDHGAPFHELDRRAQAEVLEDVRTAQRFGDLPARWVWNLWMRYALPAFYMHPWTWNEIGFGGPAYPRGYKNLGIDGLEPWERPDGDRRDPVPWAERIERARR